MRSGENATQCESTFVLQRREAAKATDGDECLTLQQMVEKGIPVEKIRAVVNRGGGVPDEDAPGCAKLMRFWINTSKTRSREQEVSQSSEMRVSSAGAGALQHMDLDIMQMSNGSAAAPTDFEALINNAQSSAASAPAAGWDPIWGKTIFKT